jgi:uncharacterized protein YbjQ (UPF0145 family)
MAKCEGCGEVFSSVYLIDGYCSDCLDDERYKDKVSNQVMNMIQKNKVESIIISTESTFENIESRLGLVSAQCIYGINIVKDIFGFIRDIVGGRVNSLENALNDATNNIIDELKEKTLNLGGDALIGVKIEHTYNNANDGTILSVFATGTVIKIKDAKINCYECKKSILKSDLTCPNCGAPQRYK